MEESVLDELKKLSKKATERRKGSPEKEHSEKIKKKPDKELKSIEVPEPRPIKKVPVKETAKKKPEPKVTKPSKPEKKKDLKPPPLPEPKPVEKPEIDISEIPRPVKKVPVKESKLKTVQKQEAIKKTDDTKTEKKRFPFFRRKPKPESVKKEKVSKEIPKTSQLEMPSLQEKESGEKGSKSMTIYEKTGSDIIIQEKIDTGGKDIVYVTTNIDKLFRHVKEKGKLRVSDAAKLFDVKDEKIEEWGKILEDHDMIELHYPAIGKPILKVRKLKKKNHKRKNKK